MVLRMGRKLPYRSAGSGGFNEQALSNVCFAFDKAGLLRKDLLGAVFGVAALRLAASERDMAPSFKPQVRRPGRCSSALPCCRVGHMACT